MDELEGKNEHVSVTTAGRVERLGRIKLWQYASHFCVREGLPAGAKHAPDAPCVMREMCPSGRAKCAITSLSGHHVRPNDASGEPSGSAEQAVPGRIGHHEEICATDTMWHFVTFWHFLLDRFVRYVMDIMFRRCVNCWFSVSTNV